MEQNRNELIEKKHQLEAARIQLKKEFLGIDQVIDEVLNTVSAWYMLPDLQEKPLVVNLWGLTGVGKTSLVQRLAELIDFGDKSFRLDMGDHDGFWKVRDQLKEIHDHSNGAPLIMMLDEFQHLRTVNEEMKEIRSSQTRFIWQLVDAGWVHIPDTSYHLSEMSALLTKASWFVAKGVEVEHGQVTGNKKFFMENAGRTHPGHEWMDDKPDRDPSKDMAFIRRCYHDMIYELDRTNHTSVFSVTELLKKMNGPETVQYLTGIYEREISPKVMDCSKALIFIIGNLDEAYTVHNNLDPDISADEFHEFCKKINVPKVKAALKRRFRNEEIARLGNNHIIYPALDSNTYRAIIQMELDKYCNTLFSNHDLKLKLDDSVYRLIYTEGVYPTQGTRPVFTTIHQVVKSKAGSILSHILVNNLNADHVSLVARENKIIADFIHNGQVIDSLSFDQPLKLEDLRRCRQDDHQAITAVHESGHAICSVMLQGLVPETVISSTANPDAGGFTLTRSDAKHIARKEIVAKLAVYLGGYAAEGVIFGEENITTGAEGDIEKATEFIASMLKQCGMGPLPARFSVESPDANLKLFDADQSINKEMARYLRAGLEMAQTLLKKEELLLLKMSDHLSDHRLMEKEEVIAFCEQYGVGFNSTTIVKDESQRFYRDFLKEKVLKISDQPAAREKSSSYVMLNKDSLKP